MTQIECLLIDATGIFEKIKVGAFRFPRNADGKVCCSSCESYMLSFVSALVSYFAYYPFSFGLMLRRYAHMISSV